MPIVSAGQRAALRGQNQLIRTGAAGAAPPPDPVAGAAPTDPNAAPAGPAAGAAGPQMSTPMTNTRPQVGQTAGGPGNPSQLPIDPVDVNAGNPQSEWQRWEDDAYAASTRRLDPEFERQRATLEQTLINRGFQPGTEAYTAAVADFDQGKNDAYATAREQARQQGLSAQEQAFGQAYRESALANALLQAREGNNTSINIAGMNANTANQAAELGRLNFLDQLGFNREEAGRAGDQWNRQFGFGQQQWNDQFGLERDQFGLQSDQADFGNYLGLMDRDFAQQQFNAGLGNQDYQRMLALFGMTPQGGPAQVDAVSPYQMQQQGQQANYANQMNAYNGMWSGLGGLGSAFLLCDRNTKIDLGPFDPGAATTALRQMPLGRWKYRDDPNGHEFVGVMAQDFGNAIHGEPRTQIATLDALGLVLGVLKDIDNRLAAIEARQNPAEYQPVNNTSEH